VREEHGAHAAFAEHALDLVLPFDEPLQALHEVLRAALPGTHGAAAGDVRAAGVAELAAVRQRSVALDAFHCRSGGTAH
jgi:hypothetical protein